LEPIFYHKPNWSRIPDVNFNFSREDTIYPGTVRTLSQINIPVRSFKYGYTNLNKTDEYDILSFFIDRKGRQKNFWLPIWKNTYVCISDILIGTLQILIKESNARYNYNQYEYVFIETIYNEFFYYQINSIEYVNSTTEKINLNNTIIQTVNIENIKYCGKLLLVRFDTDDLEFTYPTSRTNELTLPFIELVNEYYEHE